MNKYLNKTIYTVNFYAGIIYYKMKHSTFSLLAICLILFEIMTGMGMLQTSPTAARIMVLMGVIILPFVCFILPYIMNMNSYKKTIKEFNEVIVTAELTDKKAYFKNTAGNNRTIDYKEIKMIDETNTMLVITLEKGENIYLGNDDNNFIGSNKSAFINYLKEKSNIKK